LGRQTNINCKKKGDKKKGGSKVSRGSMDIKKWGQVCQKNFTDCKRKGEKLDQTGWCNGLRACIWKGEKGRTISPKKPQKKLPVG